MQQPIVAAAIVMAAALGANVYNSVVDAPNWGAAIPNSTKIMREYFATANPGTLDRVLGPLTQILALAALVTCWRRYPDARGPLGLALGGMVIADMRTFGFFYPRNAIMMSDQSNIEALRAAWHEWSAVNHVRSAAVLVASVAELTALARIASLAPR